VTERRNQSSGPPAPLTSGERERMLRAATLRPVNLMIPSSVLASS
jgi:hypothetical protein